MKRLFICSLSTQECLGTETEITSPALVLNMPHHRMDDWRSAIDVLFATFLSSLCAIALFTNPASIWADDNRDPTKVANPSLKRGFDSEKIWKVTITIPPDEFAAMQPHKPGGGLFGFWKPPGVPKNSDGTDREIHRNNFGMDLPWASGTLTIDGRTFCQVGIRYKGNGTIGDAEKTIKKSIKIDLDRLNGTEKFLGAKTINLHCGVTDPSKCRETMAYFAYRAAGVPAPGTSFTEVWLTVAGKYDSEFWGLYTLVEHVDNRFLRTHFGSDAGLLMKPEGLREIEHHGDDWEKYKKTYVPKRQPTKDEIARIVAFAKLVHKADDDAFEREIGLYIDIEAYLRFLAATSFVGNPDCFFILGHNYYLYLHPTTGQFHFIPWDVDLSLGNFPVIGTNRQQMNLSLTHPYGGKHRLTDRLLAIPKVAEQYQQLLKQLASGAFDKATLLQAAERFQVTVNDLVGRDRKAAETRGEDTNTGLRGIVGGTTPSLARFIENRVASMHGQMAGTVKGFIPSGGMSGGVFKMGSMLAEPILASIDTDKDSLASRDEWLSTVEKIFSTCRTNEDGKVTQQELAEAINAIASKPKKESDDNAQPGFGLGTFMAGPIVQRADANRDGNVDRDEILTAASKLFDEFDQAKTGKLDEDTFCELIDLLFLPVQFAKNATAK